MAADASTDAILALRRWQSDWVLFAHEVLGVRLDEDQQAVLRSVQHSSRVAVRSGHARGKDFTAAVASLCFLYLCYPCKVIQTAPTDRQVRFIMIREMKKIIQNAKVKLGGRVTSNSIQFDGHADWFLLGFKAGDKNTEAWTGFHAPNIMVVVTEASGVAQETFDAIEGLLTGNSRLLLILNPNQTSGEAYQAFKSPLYAKHTLSCLNAPNVIQRRTVVPGQVDWDWVDALTKKPGWVTRIPEENATEDGDFRWGEDWYRAGDLFRVKVMGLWPREPEGRLIPLSWVEAAQQRWQTWREAGGKIPDGVPLRLGVDVAGMGRDLNMLCHRYGDIVKEFTIPQVKDHMATVGRIKMTLQSQGAAAFVDTIGEGAGVYSRAMELGLQVASVKFSESAAGYTDITEQRTFANMRALCYWAVRDALDPQYGARLALPPDPELVEELTAVEWKNRSGGEILLEPKEDIKKRIGRSPDRADALALTFYPGSPGSGVVEGVFAGLGLF